MLSMSKQVNYYLSLFLRNSVMSITEQSLKTLCFIGLSNTKKWGYGDKRIGIKIPNSITDKIPFSGFGYKDEKGLFHIGVRMWLDQGNYVKFVPYDNRYNINQHFIELINKFQYEYSNLC
jgi:hypothetical protein